MRRWLRMNVWREKKRNPRLEKNFEIQGREGTVRNCHCLRNTLYNHRALAKPGKWV